jgi:hypothetical protein
MEQNFFSKLRLFLTCDRTVLANTPTDRIYISLNGNTPKFINGKWEKNENDQEGQYYWEEQLRTLEYMSPAVRMIAPGACQELKIVIDNK